jgi:hypothetical protein
MDKNGNYKVVYGLKVFLKASERYLARKPSAESAVTFLPPGNTLVLTSLTLTLTLLIPIFRNLGKSFIAY